MKRLSVIVFAFLFWLLSGLVASAQKCPRAYNVTKTCSNTGCIGQYESGYCGGPNDQNRQCNTYQVTCCSKTYSFSEYGDTCNVSAACGPSTKGTVGRLVTLKSADGRSGRLMVVGAFHARVGTVSPQLGSATPAAF